MPFEEVRHLPSARVYAAHHVNLVRLGHTVQYPAVLKARRMMEDRYMERTLESAKAAKIEGVLNLD